MRRGMTWIEVLIVLIIIAVLIALLLPQGGHGPRPLTIRCASNLKGQSSAFLMYSAEFNGAWPESRAHLASLCQQTLETRDAFVQEMPKGYPPEKLFYCVANKAQDPAKLWSDAGVSTWGYVWLNDRGPAGAALPTAFPPRNPPLDYMRSLRDSPRNAAMRELALDVIVSDRDSGTINFTPPLVMPSFGTNHMLSGSARDKPQGANVLCADGHVEWRKFDAAKALPLAHPGGGFFWFPNP